MRITFPVSHTIHDLTISRDLDNHTHLNTHIHPSYYPYLLDFFWFLSFILILIFQLSCIPISILWNFYIYEANSDNFITQFCTQHNNLVWKQLLQNTNINFAIPLIQYFKSVYLSMYQQILIYTQNTNICNESISYLFSHFNATLYLEHVWWPLRWVSSSCPSFSS